MAEDMRRWEMDGLGRERLALRTVAMVLFRGRQ